MKPRFSVLKSARNYIRKGWRVVPIPSGEKAPAITGWPKLQIEEPEVDDYFDEQSNIGILLGEPSKNLIDTDLDCLEAITLAPDFLPATSRIHGRKSRPASHWWYYGESPFKTEQFIFRGKTLLEIRSTGGQTVVPPSKHPSGEQIRWEKKGRPATVRPEELLNYARRLAAATLLVRHYPPIGSRNKFALALAGMLLRARWEETETEDFLDSVARAAGDEEREDRRNKGRATRKRIEKGGNATGRPTLSTLIEEKVVDQVCEWLGISDLKPIRRFPRLRLIPSSEEWPTKVVFSAVYNYFKRQIHFTQSWQPIVVTLWAMGTYLYKQFPCYGHLWLNSPTTHSGKSKLLSVLWTVCFKSTEPQLEPTPAVLFRFPSAIGGTLLLDEVDNLDPQKKSEVIAVLNSYISNGVVLRNIPGKKKDYTLAKFPTYCPKVIAGINNLPTTLQDRCIKVYLHRKRPSEKVERFMPGTFEGQEKLRDQLDAWSVRDALQIIDAYKHLDRLRVPDVIDDRGKDILEPLFAIASVLPKWVRRGLAEATESIARERNADEGESNAIVLGLQVLSEHFPTDKDVWVLRTEKALEIFSEEIASIETKPQAQALLRRLDFRSKRVRVGKSVLRGYEIPRKKLKKLLERYANKTQAA